VKIPPRWMTEGKDREVEELCRIGALGCSLGIRSAWVPSDERSFGKSTRDLVQ
jgi:hypothetical protein